MFEKVPFLLLSLKMEFFFFFFYQASNPYIGKLSILDDELALNVCITKKIMENFQNFSLALCICNCNI